MQWKTCAYHNLMLMCWYNGGMSSRERLYAAFLLDYAACEDKIHKKWSQVQEEQETLTVWIVIYSSSWNELIPPLEDNQRATETRRRNHKLCIFVPHRRLSKTKTACKGEKIWMPIRPRFEPSFHSVSVPSNHWPFDSPGDIPRIWWWHEAEKRERPRVWAVKEIWR